MFGVDCNCGFNYDNQKHIQAPLPDHNDQYTNNIHPNNNNIYQMESSGLNLLKKKLWKIHSAIVAMISTTTIIDRLSESVLTYKLLLFHQLLTISEDFSSYSKFVLLKQKKAYFFNKKLIFYPPKEFYKHMLLVYKYVVFICLYTVYI